MLQFSKKKRKMLLLIVWFFAAISINNNVFAQNTDGKSNGKLEVISFSTPDTVVFKPAKGMEIVAGKIAVFLVSGENSLEGQISVSGSFSMSMSGDALSLPFEEAIKLALLNDECEITASDFKTPANFKAQKIKFVIDSNEMYYNLVKSVWE